MATFEAKVERREGARPVHVVSLSGRLDAMGLPIFQERLGAIPSDIGLRVVFDLSRLTFVGSAGIGLFLSFVEEVREAQGDVRFVSIPSGILSILSLLNVVEFLTQADSAEEAIAELSS
jgi:anti-sigma B factor antagonist